MIAGAAGLAAGLAWAPLGIAAATGTVAYFALAVIAHIRAGDAANLPTRPSSSCSRSPSSA